MKRVTALIGLVEGAGDDVLRAFVDYFNMLFLIDLNVFALALVECERRRDDVRVVFEAVGDLDAAVAVASFRAGRSAWCRPVILTKGSGLGITAFAHPLLRDARTNEIDLPSRRGIVITGSNMSGKTTLLRALGVNVILAQTIHTCVASRFVCPPLVVRTAIALSDSLLDGKSYYLTEATTVLSMVGADETVQHLFLLDEMFRGTNTEERIAAGVAVMGSLVANGNMAVVATHDADVVHFTRDTYDAQHFAESVTPAGLAFDFVLRPGQATGRNAISLLAALGAPDALLFRASQICAELENGEAIDAAEPASC